MTIDLFSIQIESHENRNIFNITSRNPENNNKNIIISELHARVK